MEEIVSRIEEHIGKSVSEWLVLWCIYMYIENYYHSDTLPEALSGYRRCPDE